VFSAREHPRRLSIDRSIVHHALIFHFYFTPIATLSARFLAKDRLLGGFGEEKHGA
jgi:hypothetical protein